MAEVDIDLQLFLEQTVLADQLVLQKAAEIKLVHPVVQDIKIAVQLFTVGRRLCFRQPASRTDHATVPDRLVHFGHDLILILAKCGNLDSGDDCRQLVGVERQLRHIALISGFRIDRQLGQPSFRSIGQIILFGLLDQSILANLRIVGPCPFIALGQRNFLLRSRSLYQRRAKQHQNKPLPVIQDHSFHIHPPLIRSSPSADPG